MRTIPHRIALVLLVIATALCCTPPSQPIPEPFDTAPAALDAPCGPCGGGVDYGHILSICPSSQPLWAADLACYRDPAHCGMACAGWLAEYDACAASGDPACSWSDYPACDDCITTPDVSGGCRDEVTACGTDRTGCVTCAAWLAGAGDPAWLCPYDSLDAAFAVMTCACDGACAAACGGACNKYGYLDPVKARAKGCALCLHDKTRCDGARAACMAL